MFKTSLKRAAKWKKENIISKRSNGKITKSVIMINNSLHLQKGKSIFLQVWKGKTGILEG